MTTTSAQSTSIPNCYTKITKYYYRYRSVQKAAVPCMSASTRCMLPGDAFVAHLAECSCQSTGLPLLATQKGQETLLFPPLFHSRLLPALPLRLTLFLAGAVTLWVSRSVHCVPISVPLPPPLPLPGWLARATWFLNFLKLCWSAPALCLHTISISFISGFDSLCTPSGVIYSFRRFSLVLALARTGFTIWD